jgi:hypothetical protein
VLLFVVGLPPPPPPNSRKDMKINNLHEKHQGKDLILNSLPPKI